MLVVPSNVDVERVKSVLVDFEDGDLGQVADRVRQILDRVLTQVKVSQVGLKKNKNLFIMTIVLSLSILTHYLIGYK
jgi:hypothetical protein